MKALALVFLFRYLQSFSASSDAQDFNARLKIIIKKQNKWKMTKKPKKTKKNNFIGGSSIKW
jgi:hypothetical protein